MSSLKKCPNCGGMNPPDAKFCSFCGSKMEITQAPPVQQQYNEYHDDRSRGSNYQPTHPQTYHSQNFEEENKRIIAAILAFVIGVFGVHHFYLGNNEKGILYLCISWTGISAILAIIDGIIYLTETDEEFMRKHVRVL